MSVAGRRAGICLFCSFRSATAATRRLLHTSASKSRRLQLSEDRSEPWTDLFKKPRLRSRSRKEDDESEGSGRRKRVSARIPHLAVKTRMIEVRDQLRSQPFVQSYKISGNEFEDVFKKFETHIISILEAEFEKLDFKDQELYHHLRDGRFLFLERSDPHKLDTVLRDVFLRFLLNSRFSAAELARQKDLADLRYPLEWFPGTRQKQRTIHMHVGPTNSGKTYQALKRLEQAKTGAYAGPLRLLAHEVFNRLNSKGIPCALLTGEERRGPDVSHGGEVNKVSCTVEMLPSEPMDVCVIDEIQMIGDKQRGWAWTEAFCSVNAKELHLCGEERTVPLIRELCALTGDKFEIHRYQRLSPLRMAPYSLGGKLEKLTKGDCIVSFSMLSIHAIKKQVEKRTGKKVAIIYGALPPEVRAAQARLFNDPDNDYDFLVASDAVGMGLNLSIKRVIFETVRKNDGTGLRKTIAVSDIKQIGGRAGRFKVAPSNPDVIKNGSSVVNPGPSGPPEVVNSTLQTPMDSVQQTAGSESQTVGWVTTLEDDDWEIVRSALSSDVAPILSAGILPPADLVKRYSNYFPASTPFSFILQRLHEVSQMSSRFHLCVLRDQLAIADAIQGVQNLSVEDRLIFCQSPCATTAVEMRKFVSHLAEAVAKQKGGSILELPDLDLEALDAPVIQDHKLLRKLEILHKQLGLYLWLSFRFSGIFTTRALAQHVKGLTEAKIESVLETFQFSEEAQARRRRLDREQALLDQLRRQNMLPANSTNATATDQVDIANKLSALGIRAQNPEAAQPTSSMMGENHKSSGGNKSKHMTTGEDKGLTVSEDDLLTMEMETYNLGADSDTLVSEPDMRSTTEMEDFKKEPDDSTALSSNIQDRTLPSTAKSDLEEPRKAAAG